MRANEREVRVEVAESVRVRVRLIIHALGHRGLLMRVFRHLCY